MGSVLSGGPFENDCDGNTEDVRYGEGYPLIVV